MTAPCSAIRILSDLHSAPGRPATAAAVEIRRLAADPATKAIILNGDTWEGWAYPHDKVPPPLAGVIAADADLCDTLRQATGRQMKSAESRASRGMATFFDGPEVWIVVGNHDRELTQALLDSVLYPDGLPDPPDRRPRVVPAYRSGLLLVHHGHRDTLLCRDDPEDEPWRALPLSYWLARILPDGFRLTERLLLPGLRAVAELLLDPGTLAERLLDAACELAPPPQPVWIVVGTQGAPHGIGDLKNRYRRLWRTGRRRFGGRIGALEALFADVLPDGLLPSMRARARAGYRVIVTGHTHSPGLWRPVHPHEETAVLANSGCCVEGRLDRVDVEKLGAGRYVVRRYERGELQGETGV